MQSVRMTLDELTGHLRQKDVLCVTDVQFAILETNGELSVFPYPEKKPADAADAKIKVTKQSLPGTIIEDGRLSEENLRLAGKGKTWLEKVLTNHQAVAETTLYLTVDSEDKIQFQKKEKSR